MVLPPLVPLTSCAKFPRTHPSLTLHCQNFLWTYLLGLPPMLKTFKAVGRRSFPPQESANVSGSSPPPPPVKSRFIARAFISEGRGTIPAEQSLPCSFRTPPSSVVFGPQLFTELCLSRFQSFRSIPFQSVYPARFRCLWSSCFPPPNNELSTLRPDSARFCISNACRVSFREAGAPLPFFAHEGNRIARSFIPTPLLYFFQRCSFFLRLSLPICGMATLFFTFLSTGKFFFLHAFDLLSASFERLRRGDDFSSVQAPSEESRRLHFFRTCNGFE